MDLKLFGIFKILLLSSVSLTVSQKLECIDTLNDYQDNSWTVSTAVTLNYAPTAADLPGVFQGNLEADGILFYHGNDLKQQMMYKMGANFENIQPAYMYVRYYGSSTEHGMFLYPASSEAYQFLPNTTNYEWAEDFMQANGTTMQFLGLNVGTNFIENEDYFFVDKIIVAQGYEDIQGVEDLKRLCGWAGEITDPPPEHTTVPSGSDVCEAPGFIPHSTQCSSFHVCLYDAFGIFGDLLFTCPAPQVWCQKSLRCEIPQVCPCTI